MNKAIKINPADNTAVALENLSKGSVILGVTLTGDIPQGHKFAVCDIEKDAPVIKYGNAIGRALEPIHSGAHVHTHNTVTLLSGKSEYSYIKEAACAGKAQTRIEARVRVYERKNGEAGVRNELWVLPTVGCVNSQAVAIAEAFKSKYGADGIDGVYAFTHPYGCSQLGDDHERTKKILARIALHPNAGGVLILGLGCENNTVEQFKLALGAYDKERIRFLTAQDVGDETEAGAALLKELYDEAKNDKRVEKGISCLKIGLKCGGSDGLSGVTANPLLGMFSDYLTSLGGTAALTEVPEMFGAEHILMNRARDVNVFDKTVALINGFKDYFTQSGVPVYENPSPGNKAGGITTLEDKSLGCTQKAGGGEVADVLNEGEAIKTRGLNLVNGPGNDMVAVTNLGAAGCHMVLFTTGRGTPFGGFVPTVKVSTNGGLFERKNNWIDFDAGRVLDEGFDGVLDGFISFVAEVASGWRVKNELNNNREIAIFKTGITL